MNRPGLAEIDYRAATHASFLRAMTDRIALHAVDRGPHAGSRPLAALGTRDTEDPAIALLDAAAVTLDILSFYNERIANEGFLGTATERLSVLHLARAIGYELGPGVAADVVLVFDVGATPGDAPSEALIPARTKVQSLPAAGALPQTFETLQDFTAQRAWNAMRPRARHTQTLRAAAGGGIERIDIDGGLVATDEIVLRGTGRLIAAGDLLLVHVDGGTTILRVAAVDEDHETAVTRLTVEEPDGAVAEESGPFEGTGGETGVEPTGTGPVPLTTAAVEDVLGTALSESDLQLLLTDRRWDQAAFLDAVGEAVAAGPPAPSAFAGVFVLRRRTGLFGHNTQPYASLPISQREGEYHDVPGSGDPPTRTATFFPPLYPESWEGNTVWENSQGTEYSDADLYLERDLDDVLDTGWVVLEGDAGTWTLRAYRIDDRRTATLADYGLSGQSTALDVSDAGTGAPTKPDFLLRKTAAHAASEWLELADLVIDAPVSGDGIELAGMILGLAEGQAVVIRGERADAAGVVGTEVATITAITHHHGRTTLTFAAALTDSYVRSSVVVHGNSVPATHGETVDQPLGSGNAAVANQAFRLRTSPLTYIAAATATGSASTLEVRVNGRLWQEVRSLHGSDPDDQVYTVRIADDATATVTFGDGTSGARPPTGTENITAHYRAGTGPDGEVDAGLIQLLMTRPPGVTSVTNPLPAAGAEAPETLASARANAPMTVRTLDRVVSLTDFEDFAATFAGMGKARADVIRLHGSRLVHITVGSSTGGQVTPDKAALLLDAIDAVRAPGEAACVATYRPLAFDISGAIRTNPALDRDAVLRDVTAALQSAFSFANRRFAQGVSVAEILSVLHDVDGVIAADIDSLTVSGGDTTTVAVPPLGVLAAHGARLAEGATTLTCDSVEPADLLVVNPGGIALGAWPVEVPS